MSGNRGRERCERRRVCPLTVGWNKRATTNYLLRDLRASIEDCRKTLELNPSHFGALSGMGLCHLGLFEFAEAGGIRLCSSPPPTGEKQPRFNAAVYCASRHPCPTDGDIERPCVYHG